MSFDPNLPTDLKEMQTWFAAIITQPLLPGSKLPKMTPNHLPIKKEAKRYITPNQFLKAHERIELYSQQYWWRLLSHLHEFFPTTTAVLGYRQFNIKIGFPYLTKYPMNHWSLNFLGSRLPRWIKEEYRGKWPKRIHNFCRVDLAFNDAFFVEQKKPLSMETLPIPGKLDSLIGTKIYLQKHIHLFDFPYDLFAFRTKIVDQKVDYWQDNPLPPIKNSGKHHFIIWRNKHNDAVWDHLDPLEHKLLSFFQRGASIEEVCRQLKPKESEEAAANLSSWFERWVKQGLLTLE